MTAAFDFVPIWTGILGLGVFLYVLLDGFDLGVGILYSFAPDAPARNLVMNSVAPIWDGNETWLVLGGVGLLAAFPLAFAIIMPAVYFPILVMLLALVFRGVAFEFRYRDALGRTFWDHAFGIGSTLATFAQGDRARRVHPGLRDRRARISPAARSTASRRSRSSPASRWCSATGCWARAGWSSRPRAICRPGRAAPGAGASRRAGRDRGGEPLDAAGAGSGHRRALVRLAQHRDPVAGAAPHRSRSRGANGARSTAGPRPARSPGRSACSCCPTSGIAISLWPMIVPYKYTLWQAASSPSTQAFLLVGTLFLLPIILMYTAWSYWVFRGKVRGDIGYH